ncbi:MAG: hypothetical protein K9H49_14770 [Bacteroidales bacterium]|nr:hypothetical protein [Bacteroidales bacterium]MCF8390648.1 hypothetical protein [Bacteroidales bacterium]
MLHFFSLLLISSLSWFDLFVHFPDKFRDFLVNQWQVRLKNNRPVHLNWIKMLFLAQTSPQTIEMSVFEHMGGVHFDRLSVKCGDVAVPELAEGWFLNLRFLSLPKDGVVVPEPAEGWCGDFVGAPACIAYA